MSSIGGGGGGNSGSAAAGAGGCSGRAKEFAAVVGVAIAVGRAALFGMLVAGIGGVDEVQVASAASVVLVLADTNAAAVSALATLASDNMYNPLAPDGGSSSGCW